MGQPDFRVGGRIFATLATQHLAYGNVKRTPEQQVEEMPEVFLPVGGGWGRTRMTHVRLAAASEDVGSAAYRLEIARGYEGEGASPERGFCKTRARTREK